MARILVVDDEKGLRSFLSGCLVTEGHKVDEAEHGRAALARLADHHYDLMITDLKMPELDGLGLMAQAFIEQPHLQVLVLTAHATVDSAVHAMKLGAFDYLRKPLSGPAEIRLLVARALERRQLLAVNERTRRDDTPPRLAWGDPAMEAAVRQLERVAPTDATVLLLGESGVGKDLAARAIHLRSPRAAAPFVAINCASLSESLLESELFGHERGAFTGATAQKRGRLELADGGTFFLDEIGELRPALQARLLRVIQDRTFERVGGTRSIEVDVRWIAATNRDLRRRIAGGEFREDLYHRLAVFPLRLPALRERRADIIPLAEALLAARGLQLDPDTHGRLRAASWHGNVRELANVLERAAILRTGETIRDADLLMDEALVIEPLPLPTPPPDATGLAQTVEQIERRTIEDALAAVGGNRRQAAERLGIGLRTLYEKLKRHGL